MTVETTPVDAANEPHPYLLYCGRIDVNKGCVQLLDAFAAWKRAHPSSTLELILTGHDVLGVGTRPGVRYLGFVDERRKFELMAGALAFVQPSPYETSASSCSRPWPKACRWWSTPNARPCSNIIEASGSNFSYRGESAMREAFDAVLALDAAARAEQGRRARDYVVAHYGREEITARLLAEVEALAGH